jgi:hypothetical protein
VKVLVLNGILSRAYGHIITLSLWRLAHLLLLNIIIMEAQLKDETRPTLQEIIYDI